MFGSFHVSFSRWFQAAGFGLVAVCVAGCGGGGGDSGSNNGGTPFVPSGGNQAAVSVDTGVSRVINIPTVSVTVCAPGSNTNCQTIDHVQLDTGSYGLRVVGSVLNSSLSGALPVTTIGSAQVGECANFADGYTWGTVRTANVTIAGETASSIPIQIIGDLASSTVPSACVSGASENTASDLGANGILGIGVRPNDCGSTCATSALSSNYYTCPNGTSCARTALPVTQQVANPVQQFPVDNNGVIVAMQSISSSGAATGSGTVTFGIGTQSNNALAASNQFTTDASGDLPGSTLNGVTVNAFLDSGSNALFFSDSTMTLCGSNFQGFYCPSSPTTRNASLVGANGVSGTVTLNITSASTLFANGNNFAFNDLAGQLGTGTLDIGLPFFYGRSIYYGMDRRASGGAAPYVAF
ncbi:DUF3443 domain-containing protein [Paraburkholderia sp.]|uniref:DUF3443 domain-containing protein n=1 Tax=Paraburkholderia sp. TaxID=1926495 RepID=UPI003D6ED669